MAVLLAVPLTAAEPPANPAARAALEEMEVLRSERRVNARPLSLVAAYYSVEGKDDTEVILLNTFSDPMTADLSAIDARGEARPLGSFTVEPTRHLALSVRELLAGAPATFATGSLRLSFVGDFEMLQAWAVLRGKAGATELPFKGIGKELAQAMLSFWDAGAVRAGRAAPRYDLFNGGADPLTVQVELLQGTGPGRPRTVRRRLRPGSRLTVLPLGVAPDLVAGAVRITHDGDPGALAISGLLVGDAFRAVLPVAPPGDPVRPSEFHAVGLPLAAGLDRGSARPVVVLRNPGEVEQRVAVTVLDQATGAELQTRERRLRGGEVQALDLTSAAAAAAPTRLRIRGERGLQVAGFVEQATGGATDIAFFSRSEAHKSGSYPLLPLAEAEVGTTLVNLGREPARVLAQIFWRTGAWSLPPIDIPPGASYRLDPEALAAEGAADILGRTLDPAYEQGFLQWVSTGGHELIARTEARAKDSADAIGFSCFGCCARNSTGSIMPGTVNFSIGQTPFFQACETITTCNSVLGPYPALITQLTYAAPFSWDGVRIGASGAAFQNVRFDGIGEKIYNLQTCDVEEKGIFGRGDADTCQKTHNPRNFDAGRTCTSQTFTCTDCYTCCSNVYEQEVCRCGGTVLCRQARDPERRACDGHCLTDRCN
jgi:hypothetical protein